MKPETQTLYSKSPTNPVRPIIAPDVIVEQVSANANWNSQNARNATPVVSYVAGAPFKKNQFRQMNPLPWLNMKAKPNAKKSRPQRQVSTMHSISTLTVSRERQKPASSMEKPTCMPKTRNAAT